MIRCVAFDFDGTLVDSNRIKREAFDVVVAHVPGGVERMADIFRGTPGDRYAVFATFVARSAAAGGSRDPLDARTLAAEYTRRCEDAIASCDEVPGATALLRGLRERGIARALVSATPREPLLAVVARRGWASAFDHVLGSPASKAANLAQLASQAGLDRGDIVMVGDREDDRAGARAFGCPFVALARPDNDFVDPPAHVIDRLEQLWDVLPRLDTPSEP